MRCASCAAGIERVVHRVEGVVEAEANVATERAIVAYMPTQVDTATIKQAIRNAGYAPREADEETTDRAADAKAAAFRTLRTKLIVSAILSGPIFTGSMLSSMAWVPSWLQHPYLLLLLATPVQFWSGWTFYRGLWASLKHQTADMTP
jgi:Cu+-exporting ATPase